MNDFSVVRIQRCADHRNPPTQFEERGIRRTRLEGLREGDRHGVERCRPDGFIERGPCSSTRVGSRVEVCFAEIVSNTQHKTIEEHAPFAGTNLEHQWKASIHLILSHGVGRSLLDHRILVRVGRNT